MALERLEELADLAVRRAARTREEVDDLNVYPVPDGDTGTNVYLTLEAALAALREELDAPREGGADPGAVDPAAVDGTKVSHGSPVSDHRGGRRARSGRWRCRGRR